MKAIIILGQSNAKGLNSDFLTALADDDRFNVPVTTTHTNGFPSIQMYDPFSDSKGSIGATYNSTPVGPIARDVTTLSAVNAATSYFELSSGSFESIPAAGQKIILVAGTSAQAGEYTVDSGTASTSTRIYVTASLTNEAINPATLAAVYQGGITSLFSHDTVMRLNNQNTSESLFLGPELSLGWDFTNYFGEKILIIKLAVDSSTLTPKASPTTKQTTKGWMDQSQSDTATYPHNDWNPSSVEKLYDALTNGYLLAAGDPDVNNIPNPWDRAVYKKPAGNVQAALPLDIIGVFCSIGEADSLYDQRASAFGSAMRLLRDKLRGFIFDNGLTLSCGSAAEIPWVMARMPKELIDVPVGGVTGFFRPALINVHIDEIVTEDDFCAAVNTDGLGKEADLLHYTAAAQIVKGDRLFNGWQDVYENAGNKTLKGKTATSDPRQTVAEVIADAKLMYARNKGSKDFNDNNITLFIKQAQHDIINSAGDLAYFVREVVELSWSADSNELIQLPQNISRIVRIEDANYPSESIRFEVKSHEDGKMTVRVPGRGTSGRFRVYHIPEPDELLSSDSVVSIPRAFAELLLVAVVRRMARHGSDTRLHQNMMEEEARLMRQMRRHMQLNERGRNMFMYNGTPTVLRSPHAHDSFITGYVR